MHMCHLYCNTYGIACQHSVRVLVHTQCYTESFTSVQYIVAISHCIALYNQITDELWLIAVHYNVCISIYR
jgi:hypothetical protein